MMDASTPEDEIRCVLCGAAIELGGPPGSLLLSAEGEPVCRECLLKIDPALVEHADMVDRLLRTEPEKN